MDFDIFLAEVLLIK